MLPYCCHSSHTMTPMTSVRVTVLVLLVCLPSLLATNSTHTDQLLQRIMFGSCFNPQLGGQIWTVINSFSPNQLILLGDNIYADRIVEKPIFTVTPTEIETQYKLLVNDAHWKKLFATVGGWDSISITYDDHDYGINNADKYFPYRNESQHLFWHYTDAYTRQNINRESVPSGVYSSSTRTVTNRAGQDILKYKTVLIDNRSNKDPKGTVNGDFLGEEQWQWLAKELLLVDKDIDMILLGSGIQVLPDEKLVEENWSEFPAAKDRLMTLICLSPVANIFILSGDIHSAEVNKATCKVTGTVTVPDGTSELLEVSRPVLEFTSSGLTRTFITKTVQQQENNTVTDIRCTSKGQFYEFINGLYQVLYQVDTIYVTSINLVYCFC